MPTDTFVSRVNHRSSDFKANRSRLVQLLDDLRGEEKLIRQGGGARATEAQRRKGRLTARERLSLLLDPRTALRSH